MRDALTNALKQMRLRQARTTDLGLNSPGTQINFDRVFVGSFVGYTEAHK
jgi:hypothetical protein